MVKRNDTPLGTSVAAPREHFSREVYNGAELHTRSSRPGAYDALALPSLFNGKTKVPDTALPPVTAPYVPRAPEPAPLLGPRDQGPLRTLRPARVSISPYTARTGSAPARVLSHLRSVGGAITYVEIAARFNVPQGTITASFKPALKRGALVRHVINGHVALSLPGFTPPAPDPDPELLERTELLEHRKAELQQWHEYVQQLGQRCLHVRTPILRPLFPPTHNQAA